MYSAINLKKNAVGDGTTYFSVSLDLNEKVFLIRHSGGSRGGVQGVRTPPPLLGHDVGFLTLGPKLDPPFCECPRVGVFFNFSEGG